MEAMILLRRKGRNRDGQEDQAADEHDSQTLLPGVAHAKADGVGEEGVQTHAGRLREGHVGQEGGEQAADGGADAGGQHHSGVIHARLGQEVGVDKDDVGHREEGGNAAHDLGQHGGLVLLELEGLLEQLHDRNALRFNFVLRGKTAFIIPEKANTSSAIVNLFLKILQKCEPNGFSKRLMFGKSFSRLCLLFVCIL